MVDITLTLSDQAKIDRVRTAFLGRYPKDEEFLGTDLEWIKENIIRWIKREVSIQERNVAEDAIDLEDMKDIIS